MQVIRQVREKLRLHCAPVQIPLGLEHEHRGLVDLLDMRALQFEGAFGEQVKEVQSADASKLNLPLMHDVHVMRHTGKHAYPTTPRQLACQHDRVL